MTIITQADKGDLLSALEADNNIDELRNGVGAVTPAAAAATGMKVGTYGSATDGWHDLTGTVQIYGGATDATRELYRAPISALRFVETTADLAYVDFHVPHDYRIGTDIYIHAHWSHNGTGVTGGSITWDFNLMYAKGHNQGAFAAPIVVSTTQNASTTQYQHMIAEEIASTSGGSPTLLDTDLLEPDGLIQCAIRLNSNDLTGTAADVFVHMVDIHYQSTNVPTLRRNVSTGSFYI